MTPDPHKTKRGTPRRNKPGAGRPETGRVKRDVAMTPAEWQRLNELRGTTPRGVWIAENLRL